jgi:hypothetical protein
MRTHGPQTGRLSSPGGVHVESFTLDRLVDLNNRTTTSPGFHHDVDDLEWESILVAIMADMSFVIVVFVILGCVDNGSEYD